MVNLLDDVLGNVTSLLKARGLWDNTLMILTSDNGGTYLALQRPFPRRLTPCCCCCMQVP